MRGESRSGRLSRSCGRSSQGGGRQGRRRLKEAARQSRAGDSVQLVQHAAYELAELLLGPAGDSNMYEVPSCAEIRYSTLTETEIERKERLGLPLVGHLEGIREADDRVSLDGLGGLQRHRRRGRV